MNVLNKEIISKGDRVKVIDSKLKTFGLEGEAISEPEEFLGERYIRVNINKKNGTRVVRFNIKQLKKY